MPYSVVESYIPDSPSVEKTLSLSTTKGKPISVKISYTSYEEKTVEYTADAADITISSTLPLPASSAGQRVYRVRFAPEVAFSRLKLLRLIVKDKEDELGPHIDREGDFTAIDVTVTNSDGSTTFTTLQRIYRVVEDPTI